MAKSAKYAQLELGSPDEPAIKLINQTEENPFTVEINAENKEVFISSPKGKVVITTAVGNNDEGAAKIIVDATTEQISLTIEQTEIVMNKEGIQAKCGANEMVINKDEHSWKWESGSMTAAGGNIELKAENISMQGAVNVNGKLNVA